MKKTCTLLVALVAGILQAETVLTFSPSGSDKQKTDCLPTDISSPNAPFTWEVWFCVASGKLNIAENRILAQTGWLWKDNGRLVLETRNNSTQTGGKTKLAVFYNNGSNQRVIGTTTITAGWHHAAMVRNGNTISIYLDGNFENSTNGYIYAPTGNATTQPFVIAPAFYGSLAEVRVWNVARTAEEIAAYKDVRLTGNEANLIGYWPLNEGTESVTPTNVVTGVAAVSKTASGMTAGYNVGAGTASYEEKDDLVFDVLVAGGGGKTVRVSGTWLKENTTRAATDDAANERLKVWQCYVLGLNPEDAANDFRITSFPMNANGTPNLAGIEVSPSTNGWNVSGATYKVKGKAMLADGWQDIDPASVNPALRFFAVELVLP